MGENLTNYNTLISGHNDPQLNKFIRDVIIQHEDYIVYLDNDLNIQWHIKNFLITPELGKILNQVSILQAQSDFMHMGKWLRLISRSLGAYSQLFSDFFSDPALHRIRSLLGESVARVFDGNNNEEAKTALNEAHKLIQAKNSEYARKWYYSYAAIVSGFVFGISVILWQWRILFIELVGQTAFELVFCSLFGAIGAFVFVARRGQSIQLNAILGAKVHRLEADARIVTGIVAAALINLAIKSGFIFSVIPNSMQLKFMVMMSILSGYSERIIPNMVKKLQTEITNDAK